MKHTQFFLIKFLIVQFFSSYVCVQQIQPYGSVYWHFTGLSPKIHLYQTTPGLGQTQALVNSNVYISMLLYFVAEQLSK